MLIQKLRLQRGWSQQQLAEMSGLSTRTIQRLENGSPASVESFKSIAAVFEVDFSTLQGEPSMNTAASFAPEPTSAPYTTQDEENAMQYVRELKRFYKKLLIYCIVMPILFAVNWLNQPQHWWVVWVALGWGLLLLLRAFKLFGLNQWFGPQWEKQQVEKRLGRKL